MSLNEAKLNELLGTMVNELGAAVNSTLVLIGDKLGLYKALAQSDGLTAAGLAEATGCNVRYVQEWLAAQAASGFVAYDAQSERFSMTPEQVAVFADENSPALMTGGFYTVASVFADEPKISEAFVSGDGIAWGDHHNCLFCGVEKFFQPSYNGSLVSSAGNKATFEEQAEKYLPRFGGYCAFGASLGILFPVEIDTWEIIDGRLVFQYSQDIKQKFGEQKHENIQKANENWPKLEEEKQ